MIGMTKDNATKLFRIYRQKGLAALLELKYKGRRPRLTLEQEQRLQSEHVPHFRTLTEGKVWIEEQYKLRYSIGGISILFDRLGIKKKTGRATHHRQDFDAQEAFKKNS